MYAFNQAFCVNATNDVIMMPLQCTVMTTQKNSHELNTRKLGVQLCAKMVRIRENKTKPKHSRLVY